MYGGFCQTIGGVSVHKYKYESTLVHGKTRSNTPVTEHCRQVDKTHKIIFFLKIKITQKNQNLHISSTSYTKISASGVSLKGSKAKDVKEREKEERKLVITMAS